MPDDCASGHSSVASKASDWASRLPDGASNGPVKSTPMRAASSEPDSRVPPTSGTSRRFQIQPRLGTWTASRSDSPARTYPWPDTAPGCRELEAACSGRPLWSLPPRDLVGLLRKTCQDSQAAIKAWISGSASMPWPSSGTVSVTLNWMPNTTVFLSVADACSLSDALEARPVPERYFLTPRAATGILRRAKERNVELPVELMEALRVLSTTATTTVTPESTMVTAGPSPPSPSPNATPSAFRLPGRSPAVGRELEANMVNQLQPPSGMPSRQEPERDPTAMVGESLLPRPSASTPTRIQSTAPSLGPLAPTPGKESLVREDIRLLRRLTPLETERLQGFPDGWTCLCGGTQRNPGEYAWTPEQLLVIAAKKAAKERLLEDGELWMEGAVPWPDNWNLKPRERERERGGVLVGRSRRAPEWPGGRQP